MKKSKFKKLVLRIGAYSTKKQRYFLFEYLYLTFGFDDMEKIEKRILNEIMTTDDEMLPKQEAKKVKAACKTILKSYKHL